MSTDTTLVLAAVRQLPGVGGAEAGPEGQDGSPEIRVQLAQGADWQDVEPAVRRLVAAGAPDAGQVRVVPLSRPRPGPPPAERLSLVDDVAEPAQPARTPARPQLCRLDLSTVGQQVTATVELAAHGRTASGTSSALVTGNGLARAVAEAALKALDGLLGDAAHLVLEHVEVAARHESPLALVHVSLVSSAGSQLLAGAAVVRHDPSDAVVRAVLDASNRRVAALLAG